MPEYEVDFSGKVLEGHCINVTAPSADQAEYLAEEQIKETFTDLVDVKIDAVRELTNGS
jgi:hypothetical protein